MSENELRDLIREIVEEMSCPRYLTPRQASELTGFSCKSLERRRERGLPPEYRRVGRSVRYRVADLREWLGDAPRER